MPVTSSRRTAAAESGAVERRLKPFPAGGPASFGVASMRATTSATAVRLPPAAAGAPPPVCVAASASSIARPARRPGVCCGDWAAQQLSSSSLRNPCIATKDRSHLAGLFIAFQ